MHSERNPLSVRRLLLLLIVTTLPLPAALAAEKTDLDRMQGTWVHAVFKAGTRGNTIVHTPTGDRLYLAIDGRHGTWRRERKKDKTSKAVGFGIRLEPSRTPKHIDLTEFSNPAYFFTGKAPPIIRGVYQFKDKDRLWITHFGGSMRPASIEATVFQLLYVRVRGASVTRINISREGGARTAVVTATVHNASDQSTRSAVRVTLPSSLSLASASDTRTVTVNPWKTVRVSWNVRVVGDVGKDDRVEVRTVAASR